jgi:transposase InsO family protein
MYMSYTSNPHLPRVRMEAVRLVSYRGWSMRRVARHIGVEPSTIHRWVRLDPTGGFRFIPTKSSRPHHHPSALPQKIVGRILALRDERRQCAEILHHRLSAEGVVVSLSSVKRVLRRAGASRFSKWKRWHQYPPRPSPEAPGILVEIDAVHEGVPSERVSAYALIDVCSRWAHAEPILRISSRATACFLASAQQRAPFAFRTVQTDHGSEFSKWFTKTAGHAGIGHRHTRVRTPTDNGHVERFIRTLQDECLHRIPRKLAVWQREIPQFLRYYNEERPHMGLGMKTPAEKIAEVLRRY